MDNLYIIQELQTDSHFRNVGDASILFPFA
jgi:hypothetical protein